MSWPAVFDVASLLVAAGTGLIGAVQAAAARHVGRRLFGLGILFGSASAVFALAGRDGRNAGGDDPVAQAAALCIVLIGLGVIGLGAALALRQREAFGELEDFEALTPTQTTQSGNANPGNEKIGPR